MRQNERRERKKERKVGRERGRERKRERERMRSSPCQNVGNQVILLFENFVFFEEVPNL